MAVARLLDLVGGARGLADRDVADDPDVVLEAMLRWPMGRLRPHWSWMKNVLIHAGNLVMKMPSKYLWPPRCKMNFYNGRGKLLISSCDRRLDLADTLMAFWPHRSRTVYLGISSANPKWRTWDFESLRAIEHLVMYDLEFDAYRVKINRVSNIEEIKEGGEFLWKLIICDL